MREIMEMIITIRKKGRAMQLKKVDKVNQWIWNLKNIVHLRLKIANRNKLNA